MIESGNETSKEQTQFTEEETIYIKDQLNTKIELDHVSFRQSATGPLSYAEGWRVLNLANNIFGFNGWSSQILSFTTDFIDVMEPNRISLGITCSVRITLKDGTFREDVGFGQAENQRNKALAYDKARKEAVTDAIKRAFRQFGDRLGNCLYDKSFNDKCYRQKTMNLSSKKPPEPNKVMPVPSLSSNFIPASTLKPSPNSNPPSTATNITTTTAVNSPIVIKKSSTNIYEMEDALINDTGN